MRKPTTRIGDAVIAQNAILESNMSEEIQIKTQAAINQETHGALFGINGEPGLVQKMDEIYNILIAFKLFGKAVMWCALFLGGVGTAIAGLFQTIKYFKK